MIPGYTPAAKYPVSTLPKHITFSIRPATEFELLMADVTQERVYIVALTLYNPATALEEIVYIASHAFVSDFEQPEEPPVVAAYSISPTGGTLLWNNSMLSQERMRSVYRSGIRRNTSRY